MKETANRYTIALLSVIMVCLLAVPAMAAGPVWTAKPAWNGPSVGYWSLPTFADLDGDGDYDLLIGTTGPNSILAYENTGTASSPIWTRKTAWDPPDTGWDECPAFVDLDGDGDYDLLIGTTSGNSLAYENTGTASSPIWTRKTAWDPPSLGFSTVNLAFADLDFDGDYDVLIGEGYYGKSLAYENTGTASSPIWTRKTAWDAPDVGFYSRPAFADLDFDGDYDLLIGESYGKSLAYENTGTASSPIWTRKTAWDAPDIGKSARPAFADLDGDGDCDLLFGQESGPTLAYENTGALAPGPDLTPTAITVPALTLNEPSTITATIANIGVLDAPSFNVSLSADGNVVGSTNVPSLSAGTSTNVSFEWAPISGGRLELCIDADSDKKIKEMDEANNKKCILVTVPAPDLTPTAMTAPTLLFVNEQGTINATIANIGVVDASAFSVSLSANGSVIDTVSVTSLGAGNSTNVSFEWTPTSGGYIEFCVVADSDTAIAELDEANNEKCIIVRVEDIFWQHGALIPWDVERLSTGNTLITEYGGHTVTEVNPAGEMVWQYGTGTQGSGPGELNCPHDAKRLSGGNTLITDYNNHRVIEVNPSGAIVWQYGTGTAGSGANQLDYPTDAERLSSGNTLIADRLNNRVIEVDSTGTIVREITGLYHPFDVDRLPDGNTLIADYRNHRVIEVDLTGAIVWQYGTGIPDGYGSGVNELNFPTDAERLTNGDTMIVDAMNDRVITVRTSHYDPARANNGFITRSIVWEYESKYPADAERLSSGNTLIAEAGNDRVIEVITPLTESESSTPFMIFGEVNHDIEEPILNLNVTVGNMDTTGDFYVEIHDTSYQIVTASGRILAGDTLHFYASDDNTTEFNHTVTVEEMDNGGFVQNITIVSPIVWMPDLVVTSINAYHHSTYASAWFNVSNEVDVTIENTGTTPANESNLSLCIDGVFFGSLPVPSMAAGASEIVTFTGWMPVGEDCLQAPCEFAWSSEEYNFTAVADCDNDVDEHDETNNEITVVDMACYNGYTGDEPLENVAHGTLHGGLLFTTGDGQYSSLYSVGDTQTTNYDIELPTGASVELAHLNVYYTWNKPTGTCPEMEVSITTPDGTTYTALPLLKAYNDIKCECEGSAWVLPFGNYVYDLADCINENGTYTVRVKNVCTACQYFCPAAPGIVLVYEDANAPQIEYWINEGADELIGGRRSDGGSLSLEECINNAAFPGSIDLSTVTNATLGVVSPWGDEMPDDVLYFNEIELGRGVYHGYSSPYSAAINSISMEVGAGNAQVGVNVSDVTDQLSDSGNVVGQGDDGDCMMPANAFLVVEYEGVEMIPAGVTFDKKKIDLNSNGILKAFITLPDGYNATVEDIDVSTVECEGATAFDGGSIIPGKQALEVKFKIQNMTVPAGDEVLLTVTGNLFDGTAFEGSNTVIVTHRVDTIPAASITNLTNSTYLPTSITWTWTNPPDDDFSHVMVYIDGVWKADTPSPSYTATGFSASTTYTISTQTVDTSGNVNSTWVNHTATTAPPGWVSDSGIVAELPDLGDHTTPRVFDMDGTWYLIAGENDGMFHGFYWNPKRSQWLPDSDIIVGLSDLGYHTAPTVFNMDGAWYLMSGNIYGVFHGYKWTGSAWVPDSGIVSGLGDVGTGAKPAVFCMDGILYLISGNSDGNFCAFRWTGSAWVPDSAIAQGLYDVGFNSAPAVFRMDETWYLMSGAMSGTFSGWEWTGSAWESDPAIISGLPDIEARSAPDVFNKDGTWYLISGDTYGAFYGFKWLDS